MTKKDFQVIAEILAYIHLCQNDFGKGLEKVAIQEGIDQYLKKTNANYSSEKFWAAVGKAYKENQALFTN